MDSIGVINGFHWRS